MADVFVSYVNEDRTTAEKISRGLESAGFSVWWDRHIQGGVDFGKEIDRQLHAAKTVVVLWSSRSLESEWVRDEAQQARDLKKLIPIRLDSVQPPLGFRQAQALDFGGWNGDTRVGVFSNLIDSARRFVGEGAPAAPAKVNTARPPTFTKSRIAAVAAVVLVGAVGVAVVLRSHTMASSASDRTNGRVELVAFDPLRKDEDTVRFAAGLRDALARTFAGNGIQSIAGATAAAGTSNAAATAELLLRGSVDRGEDQFKINAELVRRPEGLVLWSGAMQGEVDQTDALQVFFSAAVTRTLQCAFDVRKLAKDDPSPELFSKFLQWCGTFNGYGHSAQLEGLSSQIVAIAPQYAVSHALQALASATLADTPAVLGVSLKPEEEQGRLHRLADESARIALQLEPHNRRIEALVDFALASKDPGTAYGSESTRTSHFAESMRLLEQSLAADPQFGAARFDYAMRLSHLGRIDESRTEFERAAGLMPLVASPAVMRAMLTAAFGNVLDGRQQLADVERRTGDRSTVNNARFWLEYWYGDPKRARDYVQRGHIADFVLPGYTGRVPKCLDALLDARIKQTPMSKSQFDAVCTAATPAFPADFEAERGDVDAAYRDLKIWDGWYGHIGLLAQTLYLPHMGAVRADPRFIPFAASIGLVDYWLASGRWPDFCATEKLPYDCKEAALAARANGLTLLKPSESSAGP